MKKQYSTTYKIFLGMPVSLGASRNSGRERWNGKAWEPGKPIASLNLSGKRTVALTHNPLYCIFVIFFFFKGLPGPPGPKGEVGNPGPKASLPLSRTIRALLCRMTIAFWEKNYFIIGCSWAAVHPHKNPVIVCHSQCCVRVLGLKIAGKFVHICHRPVQTSNIIMVQC